jgi:hypothetical protein
MQLAFELALFHRASTVDGKRKQQTNQQEVKRIVAKVCVLRVALRYHPWETQISGGSYIMQL